jgi:dTDP-4-dehydrorhamnose reductase
LSDVPDASDVYGVTKRLGEIKCGTSLTLRTSFVGRQLSGIEHFFEWVISQRGKSVNGYQRAIYSGLTTQALAGVVSRLIDEHDELVGLYQVASKPISKFELITNLNELLELHLEVEPDSSYVCDRSLDGSEFRDVTGIQVPSWETMLTNFANDQAFYA